MTKLCPRGKRAAKRKFKVYPSAYANAYASKICAGKIKDPSGVKRKDFKGPKPAAKGAMIKANKGLHAENKKKRKATMPGDPMKRQEYMRKKQNPISEYDQKGKLKYTAAKKGKAMMIIIGIGKKKKVDKKMGGGMTAGSQSALGRLQKARMMMNKGGGADYMNTTKAKPRGNPAMIEKKRVSLKEKNKMSNGGNAKIKKVIKGLNKASALHKGQAKSLQSIVKKSGGGIARGGGAAIRGTNFQGVF